MIPNLEMNVQSIRVSRAVATANDFRLHSLQCSKVSSVVRVLCNEVLTNLTCVIVYHNSQSQSADRMRSLYWVGGTEKKDRL